MCDALEVLQDTFAANGRVCLEGTQGTGLSLYHGSYPYVTSRDTTVSGCLAEAGIPPGKVRRVVMVCRTYPIRVESPDGSTSGPMSQEISLDAISERSGISLGGTRDTLNKAVLFSVLFDGGAKGAGTVVRALLASTQSPEFRP